MRLESCVSVESPVLGGSGATRCVGVAVGVAVMTTMTGVAVGGIGVCVGGGCVGVAVGVGVAGHGTATSAVEDLICVPYRNQAVLVTGPHFLAIP